MSVIGKYIVMAYPGVRKIARETTKRYVLEGSFPSFVKRTDVIAVVSNEGRAKALHGAIRDTNAKSSEEWQALRAEQAKRMQKLLLAIEAEDERSDK